MGGMNLGQMIFDPLGITGVFDDRPGSAPDTTPSTWNAPGGGFIQKFQTAKRAAIDKARQDTELNLPNAGADYNSPPPPRVAPFAAQWSYVPGKGPQWLEPVDNGTSLQPKRQGDMSWNETVDNGWSSQFNTGPAKGNRF